VEPERTEPSSDASATETLLNAEAQFEGLPRSEERLPNNMTSLVFNSNKIDERPSSGVGRR